MVAIVVAPRWRSWGLVLVAAWLLGADAFARATQCSCVTSPRFPSSVVDTAFNRASGGNPPSDVDVEQEDDRGSFGTYESGFWFFDDTITLYPSQFLQSFPQLMSNMSGPYAIGLITATLYHELMHKCLSDHGAADDNAFFSCSHIAIVAGALAFACDRVQELTALINSSSDPQEVSDATDERAGLCDAYNRQRRQYNTPEGGAAATACKCGSPPYAPPPQCPGVMSPDFPIGGDCATGFPNNEVMPACAGC